MFMKPNSKNRIGVSKSSKRIFMGVLGMFLLSSCGANPHNVSVELPKSNPEEKITLYTGALDKLGLMTYIYKTKGLVVLVHDIGDRTGASEKTEAEIQANITEIVKSSLNSIGGQVTVIDYDPYFLINQRSAGYGDFKSKIMPDVIVTGGITEFDRALYTHENGVDFDVEGDVDDLPDWTINDTAGFGFSDTGKVSKARISVDFNMKSFRTFAYLPKMTSTLNMYVYKGLQDREFAVTLFGPTFGMKGIEKKVEGRHESVRLLVQASMIQLLGRYFALPYWNLLGEDLKPDRVVMASIKSTYRGLDDFKRILFVQQWLVLHGYPVRLTGVLDQNTIKALQNFDADFTGIDRQVPEDLFCKVYTTVPITAETIKNRKKLDRMLMDIQTGAVKLVPPAKSGSESALKVVTVAPKLSSKPVPKVATARPKSDSVAVPKVPAVVAPKPSHEFAPKSGTVAPKSSSKPVSKVATARPKSGSVPVPKVGTNVYGL